jgi:tRNA modification GTPase
VDRAGDELVAGELRLALEELGQVAGTVANNDVLDALFSRFCIGK